MSLPPVVSVVRIIARLNVGGPALHTMHLTAGLSSEYPTLLIAGNVAAGEADMAPEARARALPMVNLPSLGRELNPIADLRVAFQVYRLLRQIRPLIVHTHTAKAGFVGRLAALAAGVPIRVHTFHGHVFHGYFPPLKTRAFLWIERQLARVTTRIVAISPSQAEDLTAKFRICSADRVSIIPLGLDLARFAPDRTRALRDDLRVELGAGDEPIITIVGRLVPIKNHELFLQSAQRILGRGTACRFVIVGGGTLEPSLRQKAAELGIADRVHFLGWRTDLDRIYAGSDIIALTSINEGTPVCLIEGLAAGRPVVARDVGGVRDVLDGGRLGLLVRGGSPEEFAAAIDQLLSDPDLRARFGERGAAEIPARYGVERLVEDVKDLYDELLARRSRASRS